MKFPPNISVALTLPTTTRSPNGLGQMAAAIEQVASGAEKEASGKTSKNARRAEAPLPASSSEANIPSNPELSVGLSSFEKAHSIVVRQTQQGDGHSADALAALTTGGLTFFAPVDDVWDDKAWDQVGKAGVGPRLLGNHVCPPGTQIPLT